MSETGRTVTPTANDPSDDDAILRSLGYVPSFKREFSNLSTISFAFSIMGMCSSISTTFDTPLRLGGPTSVVWCWILGTVMCFTLGCSIAEICSAVPTSGGLYVASGFLVPRKYRAPFSWIVGWLNALGQVAGVSSTAYGCSTMIWGAVSISKDGTFEVTQGMIVGLMIGILVIIGIVNCLNTRSLASLTQSFVFVNLGTTIIIIIVLLATTGRSNMNSADLVFGTKGLLNGTGEPGHNWPQGIAFLFGLLSVQWTMTDYDAVSHISEEIRRAQYAAPAAIVIAVIGTGLIGWLFNITLILCAGPVTEDLLAGSAVLKIMVLRMGRGPAFFLWTLVCSVAIMVVQTALQATSRAMFALSRDHAFPDRLFFGKINKTTQTPLYAVGLATILCILPGFLALASQYAAFAIFAMTTVALDISYILPIAARRIFANHPEVQFKPGPFYMKGALGWAANIICISWTLFICIILSLPTDLPTNAQLFNYAAPITGSIMLLSGVWYFGGARKMYKGPIGAQNHNPDLLKQATVQEETRDNSTKEDFIRMEGSTFPAA